MGTWPSQTLKTKVVAWKIQALSYFTNKSSHSGLSMYHHEGSGQAKNQTISAVMLENRGRVKFVNHSI